MGVALCAGCKLHGAHRGDEAGRHRKRPCLRPDSSLHQPGDMPGPGVLDLVLRGLGHLDGSCLADIVSGSWSSEASRRREGSAMLWKMHSGICMHSLCSWVPILVGFVIHTAARGHLFDWWRCSASVTGAHAQIPFTLSLCSFLLRLDVHCQLG